MNILMKHLEEIREGRCLSKKKGTNDIFYGLIDGILKPRKNKCLIWRGCTITVRGRAYAVKNYNNKKIYPHRHVWEIYNGPIPRKHIMSNICGNTLCINPLHWRAVTHSVKFMETWARRSDRHTKQIIKYKETLKDYKNYKNYLNNKITLQSIGNRYRVTREAIRLIVEKKLKSLKGSKKIARAVRKEYLERNKKPNNFLNDFAKKYDIGVGSAAKGFERYLKEISMNKEK